MTKMNTTTVTHMGEGTSGGNAETSRGSIQHSNTNNLSGKSRNLVIIPYKVIKVNRLFTTLYGIIGKCLIRLLLFLCEDEPHNAMMGIYTLYDIKWNNHRVTVRL